MTLVVRCNPNGKLFLLGDLLLTGKTGPGVGTQIPTIPWGDPVIQQAYVENTGPIGLMQKITLCGNNVLLGWSGHYNIAREIITCLYELNRKGDIDLDSLINYFEQLPNTADREVQIIGLHLSSTSIIHFAFGAEPVELPTTNYGILSMIGSGVKLFTEYRNSIEFAPIIHPTEPVASIDQAGAISATKVLTLAAQMLAKEIATLDTLKNFFGAGYEIAYAHTEGGFRKMDGISYLFWDAAVDDKDQITIQKWPTRAFQYNYKEEILALRTFERIPELNAVGGSIFYIPPMYRDYTTSEVTNPWTPELSSRYVVSVVFVRGPNSINESYIVVFDREYNKNLLQFVQTGKHVFVNGLDEFRSMIEKRVRDRRQMAQK